jgi:hypothetical protein
MDSGADCEMRLTPKFYETLRERGSTEFELAAFGYLEPGAQVMARILIDECGMPVGEALDALADRQRDLGR